MQRRHDPLDWIVEKHQAHANRHGELEMVCGAEEWLVLAHRLALVVENGPAAAGPAWIADRSTLKQWTGFSLRLFLDLAPKAIRIREMVLDLRWLPRWKIGFMSFTGQGVDLCWLLGTSVQEIGPVVHNGASFLAKVCEIRVQSTRSILCICYDHALIFTK